MPIKPNNITAWEYFCYPALLALFFLLYTFPVFEGDFFWHLNTGQWIWEHRRLPETDPFTFTAAMQTAPEELRGMQMLLNRYWLGQLLLYGLWSAAGYHGIILARALCYTAILGMVGLWSRRVARGIVPFAALFVVGAQLLRHNNERPQLFAFVLAVIFLALLEGIREQSAAAKTRRWPWLLPPLMLVWANVHGSFLLGLGICVIYLAVHAGRAWRGTATFDQRYGWLLLATMGAALVNPNGIEPLFEFVRTSSVHFSQIQEYQSPITSLVRFRRFDPYWLIVLPTLSLLAVRRKALLAEHWLLLAALALLSLTGGRYIPFLLFALPVVLRYLPTVTLPARTEWIGALVVLALFAQFNFKSALKFRESGAFPRQAVAFLAQANPTGNLFNFSDWGGYISHFAPGRRVFIDSRLLTEQLAREHIDVLNGRNWREIFAKYQVSSALLPTRLLDRNSYRYFDAPPIVSELLRDGGWVPVYIDQVAVLFLQDIPAHRALIQRYGRDGRALLRTTADEMAR